MSLSPDLAAQQGTVDKEALLGRILWYSVPSATRLDPKLVTTELQGLGFTRKIPNIPADSDVFRRVSANAERRKVPIPDPNKADAFLPGQFENWMIRDFTAKGDALGKRIVCEVVDTQGKRLSYEQIVDLTFINPSQPGGSSTIKVDWINGWNAVNQQRAQQVVDTVLSEFKAWKGQFHDAVMRHWIKQTILGMGATAVRPTGGIYFLKEEFAGQVEALETFITDHFPPGGECHSVEIPDTSKQREMVQRAIEAETTGVVEQMMLEIADVKKAGKLTPKKFEEMNKRVREVEHKIADYSKLLETDLKAVNTRVELLAGMAKGLSNLQKKSTRKPKTRTSIEDIVKGVS
jgi:hypothetical protein